MSDDAPASSDPESEDGIDKNGLGVTLLAVVCLVLFWFLGPGWKLAFLFAEVVLISIVIWQACDPFADAAQWIGEALNLPGSVRGATLDAIASSMPELFSGIFFVVLAVSASGGGTQAELEAAGAEGYGSTIATCAGSAVYNMMLIPAVCALVISYYRTSRPAIDVEDDVVARDGLWFVGCELVLILFLFQDKMYWWMGPVFIGLYVVYIVQLSRDAGKYRVKMARVREHLEGPGAEEDEDTVVGQLRESGVRVSRAHVIKAREEDGEDDEDEDSAGVLFGITEVPLNMVSAWIVILVATVVAAAACYFLVDATRDAASALGVPTFFVAVIVAAAASSVPDTFLSIGSAMRGDDSGAVSNAFGSNIFDICICLSVPLLVNSYLTGWQPVSLLQDGEPIPGLVGLRILLVALTVITLGIIWHQRQLTRNKAFILCGLYCVFIGYAVLGSLGVLF